MMQALSDIGSPRSSTKTDATFLTQDLFVFFTGMVGNEWLDQNLYGSNIKQFVLIE